MNLFALLPMKENSERVPRKNFRKLSGKPLFFYIADTMKKTKCFKKLVINTDSKKIADMASDRYDDWVVIHERSEELCGDQMSMNRIIEFDIQQLGKESHFFQTHSTNPFLPAHYIVSALKEYKEKVIKGQHDSLFSVNALHTRLYDLKLNPINHNPDVLVRTQDLEVIYEENSNFYIFSGRTFTATKCRIGQSPCPFVMGSDRIYSLDIDDLQDWKFAEELTKGGHIKF